MVQKEVAKREEKPKNASEKKRPGQNLKLGESEELSDLDDDDYYGELNYGQEDS
jgi:hypothetical protein